MHVYLPDVIITISETKYFFRCLIIQFFSSRPLFLSSERKFLGSSMITSQECIASGLGMPCGSSVTKRKESGSLFHLRRVDFDHHKKQVYKPLL